MKKILLTTIVILLVVLIALLGRYFYKRNTFPKSGETGITGGTANLPKPEDISLAEAMTKLKNSLPYSTNFFTITEFDYKTAEFIVVFVNRTDESEKEFTNWLQNSGFSAIPKERFLLRR